MARKSNGNVIVGGQLDGADNYGGGALNGGQDVLLVELTPAGGYVHAIAVGSQGNQLGWRCTVDKNDNVLLGGLFENTVDFGGGALQGPSPGNSSFNIFIAKLDSSFAHVASKEFKVSATNTYLFDLATDANANVYAVGMFDTTIDFGGGTLTSVGDRDMFLAKLDPSLGHVWSKRWGDPFYQTGTGAAVLANGNVAVTGNYSGNLNFGCGPLPSLSMGITGAFLTVLDPSGGCVSTQIINGTNVGFAGIAAFQAPDVIIGGGFYSSISLPSGGLSTGNQQDGFVARLKP
jgi:hypothetical protein